MNPRQLSALCALLGLISACTDPQLDAQEEIADTAVEPDSDSVEFEPRDRNIVNPNPSSSAAAIDARLETCEVEEALDFRIREVADQLDRLSLQFTDRHPEVIATRRLLEDLERTALENCVEELQSAFE